MKIPAIALRANDEVLYEGEIRRVRAVGWDGFTYLYNGTGFDPPLERGHVRIWFETGPTVDMPNDTEMDYQRSVKGHVVEVLGGNVRVKEAALRPFTEALKEAADRLPAWTASKTTMAEHKEEESADETALLDAWEVARDAHELASTWWNQVRWDRPGIEAQAVYNLIEQKLGKDEAQTWLWNCTPYPAGLPSEKHLGEGLDLAEGRLLLPDLLKTVSREMEEAMANRKKKAE